MEVIEERLYTLNLKKVFITPRKKRAARAIKFIKEFIKRHMKPEEILITNEVNEKIWARGAEKPPRKIKIKVVKDKEGKATVFLPQEKA
ncbi:60S ribosomal protein L31 [Candidatus Bathyarchaeota archaeon]|nr:60S ribosomal protein L31 [Candidatus Bathyarchaeota archaeon]